MPEPTRKEVAEMLTELGLDNPFSIRIVDFTDLARDRVKCVHILDWTPDERGTEIRRRVREMGGITQFHASGIVN